MRRVDQAASETLVFRFHLDIEFPLEIASDDGL
jgi:hypothetical protein